MFQITLWLILAVDKQITLVACQVILDRSCVRQPSWNNNVGTITMQPSIFERKRKTLWKKNTVTKWVPHSACKLISYCLNVCWTQKQNSDDEIYFLHKINSHIFSLDTDANQDSTSPAGEAGRVSTILIFNFIDLYFNSILLLYFIFLSIQEEDVFCVFHHPNPDKHSFRWRQEKRHPLLPSKYNKNFFSWLSDKKLASTYNVLLLCPFQDPVATQPVGYLISKDWEKLGK